MEDKSKLIPLIEIPDMGWDYENEKYTTTLDKHLEKSAKNIASAWVEPYQIIVDCNSLANHVSPGITTIQFLFSKLSVYKVNAIPCLLLGATDAELNSVSNLVLNGSWVCIRIKASQASDFDINNEIDRIIQTLDVSLEKVIVILDMEYAEFGQLSLIQLASTSLIGGIRDINLFAIFSLSITSFPINLTGIDGDSTAEINRIETALYEYLDTKSNILPRMPLYSDYCVSHPNIDEIDPRLMTMSASIRYTTQKSWLIFKGRAVKTHSFDQFYALARKVVARTEEYSGEDFSWGDGQIYEKSNNNGGTGSATTWRQIATNHHIALTIQQLSS